LLFLYGIAESWFEEKGDCYKPYATNAHWRCVACWWNDFRRLSPKDGNRTEPEPNEPN